MTRILLFVKQRLPSLWSLVDWLNAVLFRLIHRKKLQNAAGECLSAYKLQGFQFRGLQEADLSQLEDLLGRQGVQRMEHFKPHDFDRETLKAHLENPSFLMFGVFAEDRLIGYFFLRCFWNWRCFVGRLIDEPFERQGIGRVMNQIMYNTAWNSGFRCHTTVSRQNSMVMRSHANNPAVRVLKELPNDYVLIEFTRPESDVCSTPKS